MLSASMQIDRCQPSDHAANKNRQPEPKSVYIHTFLSPPHLVETHACLSPSKGFRIRSPMGSEDYVRGSQALSGNATLTVKMRSEGWQLRRRTPAEIEKHEFLCSRFLFLFER
jgi:hypothetical protein